MNYDFEAKQKGYRVPAWVFVERMCSIPRRLRRVAILDTAQGLEVRHLVDTGYRPENILAVNYSAAQLAAMTKGLRADGIEGVRTKAGDFVEVLMKWDEKLDVIGFDTTSNIASGSFPSLAAVVGMHRPKCFLGVALAGREGELVSGVVDSLLPKNDRKDSMGRANNRRHLGRALAAIESATTADGASECVMHVDDVKWGSYVSTSGQAMVWWCAGLVPHRDITRRVSKGEALIPPCCTSSDVGQTTPKSGLSAARALVEMRAKNRLFRSRLTPDQLAAYDDFSDRLSRDSTAELHWPGVDIPPTG